MKTLKPTVMCLLGGILFLTGCGQSSPVTQATSTSVANKATATPSPIPTNTNTSIPTATATITPLPTIPTFTPTFDASTIVTVTPAPKAECPKANSSILPTLTFPQNAPNLEDIAIPILNYLNSGGSLVAAVTALQKAFPTKHKVFMTGGSVYMMDVNGDTIPN